MPESSHPTTPPPDGPITHLHLIRHGEVEHPYQNVFGGTIDMGLSPKGEQQADTLADYLRQVKYHAIYASPMQRVKETMDALLEPDRRIIFQPELREIDIGEWTGLNNREVQTLYNVNPHTWLEQIEKGSIPKAETGKGFRDRIEPCLRHIISKHAGQTVAIGCHGGVIRMILSILLDVPLSRTTSYRIDYASITRVDILPHKNEIVLLNFAPWRFMSPLFP